MSHEDQDAPPEPYARLMALGQRDPRRIVPFARRAYTHGAEAVHGWSAYTLGLLVLQLDQPAEAQTVLREAEAWFLARQLAVPALHAQRALLTVRRMQGEGPDLPAAYVTLVTAYATHGLVLDAARVRFEQIAHYNVTGRWREALDLVSQIQPVIESLGLPADFARLMRLHGIALCHLGDFDAAERCFAHALTTYTQLQQRVEVARTAFESSWIAILRQHVMSARAVVAQAQRLFEQQGMGFYVALCNKRLGVISDQRGHYDAAIASFLQARTQFTTYQRHDQIAECDLNLGNVAYYSGLFELALAAYVRAQEQFEQLGSLHMALVSRRNQALALVRLERPALALAHLHTLQGVAQEVGDQTELAELALAEGQTLAAMGQHAAAQEALQRAEQHFLALENGVSAAESHVEHGWLCLAQQAPVPAEAYFRTALGALTAVPNLRWRAEYGLGCCARAAGRDQEAMQHFVQASATVAELRRRLASEHASSGIFAQASRLFIDAIRLAWQRNDPRTVLVLAEQQRALTLERQRQTQASTLLHADPVHQARRNELLRLFTTSSAPPHERTAAFQSYIEWLLHTRHREPLPETPVPTPLDLPLLRQHVTVTYPQGWTILVYVPCDSDLVTVIVTGDEIWVTGQPFDDSLRDLMEQVYLPTYRKLTFLLAGLDDEPEPWAVLTTLGQRLIPEPVWLRLHPQHRLFISAGGVLHTLPWAALRQNTTWLVEQATIQVLPGLHGWASHHAQPPASDAALLVGIGHFQGRAPNLPNAIESLHLVERLWRGSTLRLANEEATCAALLEATTAPDQRRYGLVHLATHGQLTAGNGLLAHLKFYDGNLVYDDLAQLTLHGALVVLVACEGASAEVLAGEEVLSLSRALLAAGARAVVSSLWQLYNNAILQLLEPFYAGLAAGMDASSALAHAQRTLIAKAHAPDETEQLLGAPLVWASVGVLGVEPAPPGSAGGTLPAATTLLSDSA